VTRDTRSCEPSCARKQLRNFARYVLLILLFLTLCAGFAAILARLALSVLGAFGIRRPLLEDLADFAPIGFCAWICLRKRTQRWNETLRVVCAVRFNLFRQINQAPVLRALESNNHVALFLRAFTDEDTFVPLSRNELPPMLRSIEGASFVSVSNPKLAQPDLGFMVLEVPSAEWKEVVSDLMQIASVIVVDTNAGILHWLDNIGGLDPKHAGAVIAEFGRRIGLVEELQVIVDKGYSSKTVVVVPPGWNEMMLSGEIHQSIRQEQRLAEVCRSLQPLIADETEFPRTKLKRMLSLLPVTVTHEQAGMAVEAILGKATGRA
jgi:hypothetical protein